MPEIREYIDKLDIDHVLSQLKESIPEISEETHFLLRVSHLVIKEGIAAGLNLKEIASLVARLDEDEPSKLELAISTAEENATSNILVKSARSNVYKRVAAVGQGDTAHRTKRFTASTLSDISDAERDSPLSCESDSESVLCPQTSLFSPLHTDASASPVSITHNPSLSTSTSSDLSRESSSSSLVDIAKEIVEIAHVVPTKSFKLARVASFAGFDSVSVVDLDKNNSMHSTSHQAEKKKIISGTNEFKQLKWKLAVDGVRAMIGRVKKAS